MYYYDCYCQIILLPILFHFTLISVIIYLPFHYYNQRRITLLQKRTCSNCIRGTIIAVNNDVLCRDNGAVAPDYCCSKHKYTPSMLAETKSSLKCINCENFILNIASSKDHPSIGVCQLFTVRQFDGRSKNACSKFVKRTNLEVS